MAGDHEPNEARRKPQLVRVRFLLAKDDLGWPPAESEGLWAEPVGGDRYRIDNIPWFARELACDDVVRAEPDAEGVLWGVKRVRWSGACTIRVMAPRDGRPVEAELAAITEAFAAHGVDYEGNQDLGLLALSIPAEADLYAIKTLLMDGQAQGRWDYEEGCISPAWSSS